MDTQRFDALARRLGAADSRRRVLSALLAATLGQLFRGSAVDEVAANRKRGKGHRKKKKRKECGGGKQCPPEAPCCFKGRCQPLCGDSCCKNCFVEILLTGQPNLDQPVCCPANSGTICSSVGKRQNNKRNKRRGKKRRSDPADDVCCYPNQTCVKGVCCCDGCEGAVICGGTCCPISACCNGACCKNGQVCASTPGGQACVPASRACGGGQPPCFANENCHGGVCCSGNRVCDDGMGNVVCCAAGEYCEFPGTMIATCCPVNTICKGTYRGRRVRR